MELITLTMEPKNVTMDPLQEEMDVLTASKKLDGLVLKHLPMFNQLVLKLVETMLTIQVKSVMTIT